MQIHTGNSLFARPRGLAESEGFVLHHFAGEVCYSSAGFMHANTEVQGSEEEWNAFFARAQASGLFSGGSAMGKRWTVGKPADTLSDGLAGYMRFDAENIEDLLELLEAHPIIRGGGTIEICQMPKS